MARKLRVDISSLAKKLDITTKKLAVGSIGGSYSGVFKGTGTEFAGFRKYSPGDDASVIDWKASIKSNDLLVRESEEERGLNLFFLVDTSSTMLFGSIDKLKAEFAAEVVASLSLAVVDNNDSIGLGMFNQEVLRNIQPAPGQQQYYKILMNLVNYDLYGGDYDLENALKEVTTFLQDESLLFIVSDFIGLKGDWQKYLETCSHKFDVIGIMVRDPRDREMPMGVGDVVVESPYTDDKVTIHPEIIKKEYEGYVRQQENQIRDIFEDLRAEFIILTNGEKFTNPLIKMFKRRALRFH